jgi:hypothetical protein
MNGACQWTIRLSLGWTIILALFSADILFVPLEVYLAYWVRTRQGRSAAFWCYLSLLAILILASFLPDTFARTSPVVGVLVYSIGVGGLVLLLAALVLRAEIKSLYKRSWGISLPINPLLTVLFASVYLNYSIPDLPVASSSETVPTRA